MTKRTFDKIASGLREAIEYAKADKHARLAGEGLRVEPASWAKDALFVISTWGDSAGSEIVRGWETLCERIVSLHYFRPDEARRTEVMKRFVDWERWDDGPDHLPRFWHADYEDGHITVERITIPYDPDREQRMVEALRGALVVIDTLPWPSEAEAGRKVLDALTKRRAAIVAALAPFNTIEKAPP